MSKALQPKLTASAEFLDALQPLSQNVLGDTATNYDQIVCVGRKRIEALRPRITELLRRTGQHLDVTLEPEYFLEKNELRTVPIVVLISRGEQLEAVLYGRQRRVLGIRTGIVECGDHCGDGAVIAVPQFKATAIALGALKLLEVSRIHTVRVSLIVGHNDEVATIDNVISQARVKSRMRPEGVQHILILEKTFEAFLQKIGSHTRRNLRVYRRRAEHQGWRFIPRLNPEEAETAFRALEWLQGKHKSSARYLDSCRAVLERLPGSFYAGIITATGEWVSLAAGWVRNDSYFMLLQLNDARYLRDSVSAVMRSYLIEDLIGSGLSVINFIGGSSEMLRRFCKPENCAHYLLEKRSAMSWARRAVGAAFFRKSLVNRIHRSHISPQHLEILNEWPPSEQVPDNK